MIACIAMPLLIIPIPAVYLTLKLWLIGVQLIFLALGINKTFKDTA